MDSQTNLLQELEVGTGLKINENLGINARYTFGLTVGKRWKRNRLFLKQF